MGGWVDPDKYPSLVGSRYAYRVPRKNSVMPVLMLMGLRTLAVPIPCQKQRVKEKKKKKTKEEE